QRAEALLQAVDHLIVHGLLHQQTAALAAHVPLVEEYPVHDALDRLIHRRIIELDIRRLATRLERHLLVLARHRLRDRATHTRRTRERDLVDIRVVHNRTARIARTRDDVHYTQRQVGLLHDLG